MASRGRAGVVFGLWLCAGASAVGSLGVSVGAAVGAGPGALSSEFWFSPGAGVGPGTSARGAADCEPATSLPGRAPSRVNTSRHSCGPVSSGATQPPPRPLALDHPRGLLVPAVALGGPGFLPVRVSGGRRPSGFGVATPVGRALGHRCWERSSHPPMSATSHNSSAGRPPTALGPPQSLPSLFGFCFGDVAASRRAADEISSPASAAPGAPRAAV